MLISKSADKTLVNEQEIITYSIVLTNDTTIPAYNIVVTDNTPQCTTFVDGSIEIDGVPVPNSSIETGINIDILTSRASTTITFKVKVDANSTCCEIENVASVKWLSNGTSYSKISNILNIKKNCGDNTNPCDSFVSQYIIPGTGIQSVVQMVILTDEQSNAGAMMTVGNTLALSSGATKLLKSALLDSYPAKVSDVNPNNDYSMSALLVSLNNEGIISFTDTPPPQQEKTQYFVTEGEVINKSTSAGCEILPPITSQYAGRVFCVRLGEWITLYIYISTESISNKSCMSIPTGGYNAISTVGNYGFTIFPQPIKGALAADCGSCGLCGVCGACGLCGPSAAIGAASAAALSAVSLASASAAVSSRI